MEITNKVKDGIYDFVVEKNFQQNRKELPTKGRYWIENQYELAVNPKLPKYAFVLSKVTYYHNFSIEKKRIGIYAFDLKTGKEIKGFEDKEGCYVGFFNDLQIIEKIL